MVLEKLDHLGPRDNIVSIVTWHSSSYHGKSWISCVILLQLAHSRHELDGGLLSSAVHVSPISGVVMSCEEYHLMSGKAAYSQT